MSERETLADIARDMLAYERGQFEAHCPECEGTGTRWPGTDREHTCEDCGGTGIDESRDLSVSGADLVDAFTQWRVRLREALA